VITIGHRNCNRGKNGREKEKKKTENDLLDWMMKEDYSKLKERAGYRGEWLGHRVASVRHF